MAKKTASWGFDTTELDPKIRPQDDFFHHVNRKWMDKNPIPKSESRWGTFVTLRYETDTQLRAILQELHVKKGTLTDAEKVIRDFYRSGMDMEKRNALGMTPISPILKKIESIRTPEEFLTVIAYLHRIGVGVVWGAGIDQDSKNSDRYVLHVGQDGLGMPDRDYYLKGDVESKRIRDAYVIHVEKMFRLMGREAVVAKDSRDIVLRIETALAEASMKKEDRRDAEKTYHKHTIKKLEKLAPEIAWSRYLKLIQAGEPEDVIVMQPDFLKVAAEMLASVPLSDWKTYLTFHVVNDFAGGLSDPFIKQSFSFYSSVLMGTKSMRPLWRRVLGTVNGNLGELIGQIYVAKHYPKEAKQKMDLLVDDLFTAYEARIRSLDWMTPATKKKALLKLKAFNRKIGHPEKWKSYKGLVIDANDYVGNIVRTNEYEHRREMKKLKGPINRDEWFMYPQTVNAYFAASLNDIVFPAAILQPPFFSFAADDALNYGCIGAVIGHEITHGFDDEGSKFDSKGNLKSWWTDEDRKRFDAKAKKVEKQFNTYEVADGLKVNGKLTLGENIADLGGLSIAFDAYQLRLARTGRNDINGLTPEERFFLGFSLFERENVRPEFVKMQVLTDPHSPGKFRINGPVSNFEEFYKAYGLKKGDALYRAPKDREIVW